MIYLTLTTRNRFWHSALTALSLANSNCRGCFVHVLDDASDDAMAEYKGVMFEDLYRRGFIQRYEKLPERRGFCRGREMLVDRFLVEPRFSEWLHLDDDILIGSQLPQQASKDLGKLGSCLLHLYANPWAKWTAADGDFAQVTKVGGACFIAPKTVVQAIGNPYTGFDDGEAANHAFWVSLAKKNHRMYIRWTNPYQCQHTGNVDSLLFGYQPRWEHLYAKDFRTGSLVTVPPFDMPSLRAAVKSRNLSGYVWSMNAKMPNKVKIPMPGSKT